MKNILTLSALVVVVLVAFSSCKKHYDCKCDIKTVINLTDTVKSTNSHHTIKATKEDADDACKYHEIDELHLGRPAVVHHYCAIEEDDN